MLMDALQFPDPREWHYQIAHDVQGGFRYEALREIAAGNKENPALCGWMRAMLEWSWGDAGQVNILLDLGARAEKGHLRNLFCSAGHFKTTFDTKTNPAMIAEIITKMIAAGADPNASMQQSCGRSLSIVCMAIERLNTPAQRMAAVGTLLAHGAFVHGKEEELQAENPFRLAMKSGHTPLLHLLYSHGGDPDSISPEEWLHAHPSAFQWKRMIEQSKSLNEATACATINRGTHQRL